MTWIKINKNNFKQSTSSCEKTDFEKYRNFILDNKIVSYKKDINWGTTVQAYFKNGGKENGKTRMSCEDIFGKIIDHFRLYKDVNGNVILVSQPYYDKETILAYFNKLDISNDFDIKLYNKCDSWYYPGESTLFTIVLRKYAD